LALVSGPSAPGSIEPNVSIATGISQSNIYRVFMNSQPDKRDILFHGAAQYSQNTVIFNAEAR